MSDEQREKVRLEVERILRASVHVVSGRKYLDAEEVRTAALKIREACNVP